MSSGKDKRKKRAKGVRVGSPFMNELYDDGLGKLQSFHGRKNSEKGI
jgi:hypothetical protein